MKKACGTKPQALTPNEIWIWILRCWTWDSTCKVTYFFE